MPRLWILIVLIGIVAGCDKHDPILPGVRSDVFADSDLQILNESVPGAPENLSDKVVSDCPYIQKNDNSIWDRERKIFSGFTTNNYVAGTRTPVCDGGFVYAGLSTGELIKLNPKTRAVIWTADIYKPSNMTGGASVVDIIVPTVIKSNKIYVGGMGDAFCRLSNKNGAKDWCIDIGVANDFIVTDDVAYVLDTNGYVNAVRNRDGAIYWRTKVKKKMAPKYKDKTIIIGQERINAETGVIVK